ncbi:YCF48-related protein [Metapseudomonas furukawaii]|uniref:WD40/YVTN/BNR-like repeat-containing protein n=1 Tax=Metapseudomonas furukawaii TaxID=1149133 RepID=UPI00227A208F|nr:YCF48-related protein [Pseudomonas furukawaii]WAG81108.1 YCF48-related protein [Pseudomonas furukawaii]
MAAVRNLFLMFLLVSCLPAFAGQASDFLEPLDRPASAVSNLSGAHLNAVAAAGDRLVAVGVRGLIMVSDDAGASWHQVNSPVSSDLLGVTFPTPQQGWAVGHEGVVLHSADQGQSWVKQYDGRMAATQLVEHFTKLAEGGDQAALAYLDGVKLNYKDGPEQALMDVWFADDQHGFVAGTFGTLLATEDGGKTWVSWMERVDNPEFLHYLAIAGSGEQVFIASERGIVFRYNKDSGRFDLVETGYTGSFFGVEVTPQAVVAAGLRGTAYKSLDQGASWSPVETGVKVALSDVQALPDGRFLLASVDGRVIVSDAKLDGFQSVATDRPGRFSSLALLSGDRAVTVGYSGARQVNLR